MIQSPKRFLLFRRSAGDREGEIPVGPMDGTAGAASKVLYVDVSLKVKVGGYSDVLPWSKAGETE
jgi:hypothetical protein